MPKEFWINLPVADPARSRAFFEAIGVDAATSSDRMVAMRLGEKRLAVMLFPKAHFARFAGVDAADAARSAEVDALPAKVTAAGGAVFAEPAEIDGWMYGAGFADPDGHRWNILHMDPAKRQGAAP